MPLPVGEIRIDPDPPIAGQTATVEYSGTGPLYYRVRGSDDWTEVPLDETGKGKVDIPAGAEGVTLSNRRLPTPDSVWFPIVSTSASHE